MHIVTNSAGDQFHVGGRRRPKARAQFAFHNYIDRILGITQNQPKTVLPCAPADVDWSPKASAALAQMYKNNYLGCCVVACALKLRGVWTGNSDTVPNGIVFPDDDVDPLYTLLSGGVYDPNNPANTDNGCDEITALNALVSTGYKDGEKITGYVSVDASNWENVMLAHWLFEGLMTGSELSATAIANIPSVNGATWDISGTPVPTNGHCMAIVRCTPDQALLATWARLFLVKREDVQSSMVASAGGQLYGILSDEVINRATKKAPTGFDFDQLNIDMQALRATG